MAHLLTELARVHGADRAIGDDRVTLDWSGLDHRVNRWIHLLRSLGLAEGDRLAVVAGNRVETFEAVLACLHTGLTVVPVNSNLVAAEIGYLLADSGSPVVLADPERAAVTEAALGTPGVDCPTRLVTGLDDQRGFRAVEPLLSAVDDGEPSGQCCGSIMLYTSGTTGSPKGVVNAVFRQGAPLASVDRLLAYARAVLGVPTGCGALLAGPWYHSAQLYFALLPLLRGCSLTFLRRFDPLRFLQVVDEERIAVCHLVPTHLIRLLRWPAEARASFRGSSLRRVWLGGGPCPPAVKRATIEWWGPVVHEYYAATEGGVVTMIDSAESLAKPGSVGRPVPPTRVLIAGPDGRELPAGEVGRVFIRRTIAQDFHYHGAADKTRAAHLAPGVYTYGDLGHLDEDGYLYLAGREHHTIISGGVNIYPAEVEAALLAHDAVQDAVVVGMPDDEFGERLLAVVQLADRHRAGQDTAALLEAHCRGRLAGFKVPRMWRIVDRLPRDASGKLRRDALRSMAAGAVS